MISNEDITDFVFWIDPAKNSYCATGIIRGNHYDWWHPVPDCSEEEAKKKCGEAYKAIVEQLKKY